MEREICEAVQISPNTKAYCRLCRELINKGTPRSWKFGKFYNYIYKKYYCHRCMENDILNDINMLKDDIKVLRRIKATMKCLKKKCNLAIISENL